MDSFRITLITSHHSSLYCTNQPSPINVYFLLSITSPPPPPTTHHLSSSTYQPTTHPTPPQPPPKKNLQFPLENLAAKRTRTRSTLNSVSISVSALPPLEPKMPITLRGGRSGRKEKKVAKRYRVKVAVLHDQLHNYLPLTRGWKTAIFLPNNTPFVSVSQFYFSRPPLRANKRGTE